MTIIKNIACGGVKEYIKTHEAIMDYEELRSKVLQMTIFGRTESNTKTHKPEPMDISELIKEAVHRLKASSEEKNQESKVEDSRTSWKLSNISSVDEKDKYLEELMALVKGGKGKGKG